MVVAAAAAAAAACSCFCSCSSSFCCCCCCFHVKLLYFLYNFTHIDLFQTTWTNFDILISIYTHQLLVQNVGWAKWHVNHEYGYGWKLLKPKMNGETTRLPKLYTSLHVPQSVVRTSCKLRIPWYQHMYYQVPGLFATAFIDIHCILQYTSTKVLFISTCVAPES